MTIYDVAIRSVNIIKDMIHSKIGRKGTRKDICMDGFKYHSRLGWCESMRDTTGSANIGFGQDTE